MALTAPQVGKAAKWWRREIIKKRQATATVTVPSIRLSIIAFDAWLDRGSAKSPGKTFYEAARTDIPGVFKTNVGKVEIEVVMAATLLARSGII